MLWFGLGSALLELAHPDEAVDAFENATRIDPDYTAAANRLSQHLMGGFADTIADENPDSFSPQELLAWSAVHGLASLLVDGPVANGESKDRKMTRAAEMLEAMGPVFRL